MNPLLQYRLCYLASPYTHYHEGASGAFIAVSYVAGRLLKAGVKFLCPITHGHPLTEFGGVDPFDHAIWLPFNQPLMEACDALVVAQLRGWRESFGVTHEIEWFAKECRPIIYLDPNTLDAGDIPFRL